MRVLGIVPARGGSKRVPRKNLRLLAGKTLVERSIEVCAGSRLLSEIVVSSDSEEVLGIASAFTRVRAIRRPSELATDTALAIEYVQHALDVLAPATFDAIAIVQPSSPFTESRDLDACIELLASRPEADSAVSVMELDHAIHPAKLKRLEGDCLLPYLEEERGRMAAHELPRVFVRNCSVYVTRVATIATGSILGEDSRGYVMPRDRSIDINDELDWAVAEVLSRPRGT